MKITKFTFEGTPEEFKLAHPLLSADLQEAGNNAIPRQIPLTPNSPASASTIETADSTINLTEDVAEVFLTRRPLAKYQKAVMKHVMKAGDRGITISEMAKLIGCEPGSVKSAMRSFGKRVAHTQGWPHDIEAFDRTWEGSENRYRLQPAVRSVLERNRIAL